jgi:hypothetical protein
MNTSLLTTNTTNCTTKNFKMLAAVICMTAVFVFANTAIFAQGFSNSQGKTTVAKTEKQSSSLVSAKGQTVSKSEGLKEQKREVNKFTGPGFEKPATVQTKSAETAVKAIETKTTVQPIEVKKEETPKVAVERKVNPGAATSISNKQGQSIKSTEVKSNTVSPKSTVVSRTERPSSVAVRNEVKPYDISTVVNDVNKEVKYQQIPGFLATGNAAVDAKAFEVAKTNLQQSNPAEYKNYFSEK